LNLGDSAHGWGCKDAQKISEKARFSVMVLKHLYKQEMKAKADFEPLEH
jgi:hypothetical protein